MLDQSARPVALVPKNELKHMSKLDKLAWYAKRRVLAGGAKGDDDTDEDDDDDDAPAAAPAAPAPAPGANPQDEMVPVSHHCLPPSVVVDMCVALEVKHVIDFSPTPENLAFQLVTEGISYVGICPSDFAAKRLEKNLIEDLKVAVVKPGHRLHDWRLASMHADHVPPQLPEPRNAPAPSVPALGKDGKHAAGTGVGAGTGTPQTPPGRGTANGTTRPNMGALRLARAANASKGKGRSRGGGKGAAPGADSTGDRGRGRGTGGLGTTFWA